MKNTWKKAAAFTLALALVAGAAPANVGTGGLFGGSAIVANAATTVTTIDQLKNASGSVVIGADIEYSEYTFWYYEKNNVDIDLNGHTITLAKAYFGVDNGHTLTIRDSKGDGKILMKRQVRVLNGNVILEGGTLESNYNSGAIGISKGTFTMNGGTITGPKSIQCLVDGSVIINGGNVNGEFNGTGTGLSITGGIFNFDVTSLVNAGVSVTKIGNLWYVGDSAPSIVDISNATVNLAADNSVESITVGDDTITDLSGFDITYGVSDTDHTATSVPTAAGTYYAYVTPKTTNTAYTGTAKSAEITVAAKFTNASVTLGDDLALNFYLDGIADATAAAEYTVKFEGECVDKTAALAYNATEDKYYATTHVYAKNINQPITAQLYKGEEAVGAPIVTSISDYLTALKTPLAAKMAANPTNPDALTADEKKLLAMVSAAQLFGDASAAYFNPTETVNDTSVAAEITAYMTQANISDAALTAMAAQYAPTFGSDDALLSLVLDSKTAARLYVKGDTTGAESNFSSTKADYPTYHEVTGLLPQNLADEQTITVGGTDYKFSALSWCYRVLSSTSASQKNVNMAKAIMAYYTAAKNYTTAENPVPAAIPVTGTLDDPDDYLIEDDPFAFTATTSGGDNKFVADWAEDEHIAILYEVGGTKKVADATITAVDYDDGAATIQFTVEEGTPDNTPCTLVYPYSAAKDDYSGVKDAATLLAAQDGTLSANLDVRVGEGTIQTTTPGLTVTTQPEAQFAIFKFTTKNSDGSATINVTSLTVTIGAQDYVITPASATSTLYVALPAVSGQAVSFTATGSDSKTYTASKSSVTFAAGKYYKSNIKLTEQAPALNLTSPAVGQVIGDDGKNYDYASLPGGVTAVAKICYVSGSNGLALALADEDTMNWSTAISTCASHTPAFTGGTWKLATEDEWTNMITAAGSYTDLRDGFSGISGASNLQATSYWSSTESTTSGRARACGFNNGRWSNLRDSNNGKVRACLAF